MSRTPLHPTRWIWLSLLVACGNGPETNIRTLTPDIIVAPDVVDFGDVVVLEGAVEQIFISNAGRATLEMDLRIDGGDGAFEISEQPEDGVPAEESVTMGISFLPQTYLDYSADLIIESNDEDQPVLIIPITGKGVDAPRPDIDIDPMVLDFGTVAAGTPAIQFLDIHNTGNADLNLAAVEQEGSGAFSLTSDPSYGKVAAGATTPLIVTYAPTGADGDSGTLFIHSDDVDEEVVQVTLLGNGGGDFNYPIPVIDCPAGASPPEFLTLDGSGSTDPDGNLPLQYDWYLTFKPPGSQGYLTNAITDSTDLWADIAGDYEVQLQITNSIGIASAPARCLIGAVPVDDLHVELTWDTSGVDLDLHLSEDGFEMFEVPGDCNYCNKNPQWGAAGATDDPHLDLDDRSDGPENVNIESPADGTYLLKVHYFDSVVAPATTATVKVWSYGVEVFSAQKILDRDQVWDVGQINWPDGTVGVASGDPYTASTRDCY